LETGKSHIGILLDENLIRNNNKNKSSEFEYIVKNMILKYQLNVELTRPSSLSSRLSMPELSVYNFTLTTGKGWVVVKSPCVSQLQTNIEKITQTSLSCKLIRIVTQMLGYTVACTCKDYIPNN
jgi:hypothetical protein